MAVCEHFANDAHSRLIEPVSVFDFIITVEEGWRFPDQTPFRIRINNEIMLVTMKSDNVFFVDRAQEGTDADNHLVDASVANVLTVQSLMNLIGCYCQSGPASSLPSIDPEFEGMFYFPVDTSPYIYRNEGDNWASFGPFFQLEEPTETGFSWVNQGSATTVTTDGGVVLQTPGAAGENVRARVISTPGTPYTVTTSFIPLLFPTDSTSCGLVFRESATGKMVFFRLLYDTGSSIAKNDLVLSLDKYTNATTFDSNYKVASASNFKGPLIWLRITDDGINLEFSWGNASNNFLLFDSQLRDDFFTVGPNQVGYAVHSDTASGGSLMTLLSWDL